MRDAHAAEDVAQEALVAALQRPSAGGARTGEARFEVSAHEANRAAVALLPR